MIKALFIGVILQFSLVLHSQQSWQPIYYHDSIQPITILPITHDTILMGNTKSGVYPNAGIFRSIDGGETWQFFKLEYGTTNVYSLLRGKDNIIYAGTNWGIFKSEDWGESWEHLITIFNNCLCIEELHPNMLFGGFWGGVLRSFDKGITWDTCLTLDQNTAVNSILAVTEDLIYAASTSYTSTDGGLYVSEDLGDSWERIGLIQYNIQTLAMSPIDELYAGCYYSGVMKSNDYGVTWSTVLEEQDAVSVISRGNEVFVGCTQESYITSGIFYSGDNGETWEDRTHNITNDNIIQIAFSDEDYLFSLSKYQASILGPPLNRSLNTVVNLKDSWESNPNINVYPNPATSRIIIQFLENNQIEHEPISFSIFNQNGNLICTDTIRLNQDRGIIEKDVTQYVPGIYFIKLIKGKYVYSNKLLIL